jgi:hypothetical protein
MTMRRLLLGTLLLAAPSLIGCVMVDRHRRAFSTTPACHPSQYWDGTQCRHKGQGAGARKHDGAPPGRGKKK